MKITYLPEAGPNDVIDVYEPEAYVTGEDEYARDAVEESEAYWYTVVDVRGSDAYELVTTPTGFERVPPEAA